MIHDQIAYWYVPGSSTSFKKAHGCGHRLQTINISAPAIYHFYVNPCIRSAVISVKQHSEQKHVEEYDKDIDFVYRWLPIELRNHVERLIVTEKSVYYTILYYWSKQCIRKFVQSYV